MASRIKGKVISDGTALIADPKSQRQGLPLAHREFAKHVFPSRIVGRDGIKVQDNSSLGSGKGGGFHLGENIAYIPLGADAYSRTVRLHESLHAMYSPANNPLCAKLSGQAVEDAILHANFARTSGRARRDELCTAIRDLRNIPKMYSESDVAVLMALRAAAIMNGGPLDAHTTRTLKRAWKIATESPAMAHANEASKGDIAGVFANVLRDVVKLDRAGAVATLETVMTNPDQSPESDGGFRLCKDSGESVEENPYKVAEQCAKDSPAEEGPTKASTLNTDMLSDKKRKELQETKSRWPKMTIRKLHQTVSKKTKEGNESKLATSGLRIRSKKLAVAAVSPVPGRVFEKRHHVKGGCVLIDASGSMSFTDDMLRQVMRAIPLGTVAYYNGNDCIRNPLGNLVIYADKGIMYDGAMLPFRDGGNSVDLPAIQWLLAQPGPRWYIGDLSFCGAGEVFCRAARELIDNAVSRGMVKRYLSVAELLALGLGIAS